MSNVARVPHRKELKKVLQNLAPVGYNHETLSGAEEGGKYLTHAKIFLDIRRNSEGCSQYMPTFIQCLSPEHWDDGRLQILLASKALDMRLLWLS